MSDENKINDDASSTAPPCYINNFIESNKNELETIYNNESNNKEGFLFLNCDEPTNNVDVSFLDSNQYDSIFSDTNTYKTWESIKNDAGDNKIFVIKDNTYNLLIILYI